MDKYEDILFRAFNSDAEISYQSDVVTATLKTNKIKEKELYTILESNIFSYLSINDNKIVLHFRRKS